MPTPTQIRRSVPALALALATYGAVAAAPTASADSNGCTPAPRGITCINVKGHKLHVDTVAAVRDKFPPDPQICYYSAHVDVTHKDRNIWHYESGVIRNGECVTGRAYIKMKVDRNFPDGSKMCIRFFEHDEQQGGAPCAKIHD